MNESQHHPQVAVQLTLGSRVFIVGEEVYGKLEVESKAGPHAGLGLGSIYASLSGTQQLTSKFHAAKLNFLELRRIFQGPGLPPSNAVEPASRETEQYLPPGYHHARKGRTTFFFKFPLDPSFPASMSFGNDFAEVFYTAKVGVEVFWNRERRFVIDAQQVTVVEAFDEYSATASYGAAVGDGGKISVQGRIIGGMAISGRPASCEVDVKNSSPRKVSGISLALTRKLVLDHPTEERKSIELWDTLLEMPYEGSDYTVQAFSEGVASLIFTAPHSAHGSQPMVYYGGGHQRSLFQVSCFLFVRLGLGWGAPDLELQIPLRIYHPAAVPATYFRTDSPAPLSLDPLSPPPQPWNPSLNSFQPVASPPTSPILWPYRANHALPPPLTSPSFIAHPSPRHLPLPNHLSSLQISDPGDVAYSTVHPYFPPLPHVDPGLDHHPIRSSSADPSTHRPLPQPPSDLPNHVTSHDLQQHQPPMDQMRSMWEDTIVTGGEREGRRERASRISKHLRLSSRYRSLSPSRNPGSYPIGKNESSSHAEGSPGTHPSVSGLVMVPPLSGGLGVFGSRPLPSPREGRGVTPPILSPRPMPSPRQSYSVNEFGGPPSPRSDRVEELERQVEEDPGLVAPSPASLSLSGALNDVSYVQEMSLYPLGRVPSDTMPSAGDIFRPGELRPTQLTRGPPTRPVIPQPVVDAGGLTLLERRLTRPMGTVSLSEPPPLTSLHSTTGVTEAGILPEVASAFVPPMSPRGPAPPQDTIEDMRDEAKPCVARWVTEERRSAATSDEGLRGDGILVEEADNPAHRSNQEMGPSVDHASAWEPIALPEEPPMDSLLQGQSATLKRHENIGLRNRDSASEMHDIGSARGGRGGLVTSVAAVWTNIAESNIRTPETPKKMYAAQNPFRGSAERPGFNTSVLPIKPLKSSPLRSSPARASPSRRSDPINAPDSPFSGRWKPKHDKDKNPTLPRKTLPMPPSPTPVTTVVHSTLEGYAIPTTPTKSVPKLGVHMGTSVPEPASARPPRDKHPEGVPAVGQERLRQLIAKYQA